MRIYDITVPLYNGMTVYKGDPVFRRKQTMFTQKGDSVNLSVITMGTHNGTHFDAPYHLKASGKTFDRLDPALFFGKVLVVRIKDKKRIDRPELEKVDFRGAGKVFFRTSNSEYLERRRPFRRDYVHFTGKAAEYLGREKKIRMVGIDYLSVDRYHSGDHPAHTAFLKYNVLMLETINLYKVPAGMYDLFAGPLLIEKGDSGPARVFLIRK